MFNKSIRKIVLMVMAILFTFIIGTIAIIYLTSYYEIQRENQQMLHRYSNNYVYDENNFGPGMEYQENGGNNQNEEEFKPQNLPPFQKMDAFNQFYSVLFSSDGEVLKTDVPINKIYKEEDIISLANEILNKDKKQGRIGSITYLVTEKDSYTLVAFVDTAITNNNFKTLLIIAIIGGSISLVVAFFVSLFIAKKIVKPLEENDQKQKQFISDAGHELKTPVAVINANLELLGREIDDNEWLNNIKYENERMRLLVTELLDLNRAENKKQVLSDINLSHLVTGEVLPFEAIAYEKGLVIETNIKEDIHILGIENELKQLVSILLDNAIKYNVSGNIISLDLYQNHKTAYIEVKNSTKPIPQDKLEHLFERFYRLDEARDGSENHYGLGLAIAKAVVNNHKGKIKAESTDNEIKFVVEIPISK